MKTNEKRLIAALITFFVYFLVCIWVIGVEETTMQDRTGIAVLGTFVVLVAAMFPFENNKPNSNQDGLA